MYHVKPISQHHLWTIFAALCTIACTSARIILQHRRPKKVHGRRVAHRAIAGRRRFPGRAG